MRCEKAEKKKPPINGFKNVYLALAGDELLKASEKYLSCFERESVKADCKH